MQLCPAAATGNRIPGSRNSPDHEEDIVAAAGPVVVMMLAVAVVVPPAPAAPTGAVAGVNVAAEACLS